jgi:hypothetical protein
MDMWACLQAGVSYTRSCCASRLRAVAQAHDLVRAISIRAHSHMRTSSAFRAPTIAICQQPHTPCTSVRVWTCGHVEMGTCGRLDVWTYGREDVKTCLSTGVSYTRSCCACVWLRRRTTVYARYACARIRIRARAAHPDLPTSPHSISPIAPHRHIPIAPHLDNPHVPMRARPQPWCDMQRHEATTQYCRRAHAHMRTCALQCVDMSYRERRRVSRLQHQRTHMRAGCIHMHSPPPSQAL